MRITNNVSAKAYNTFGIDATIPTLIEINQFSDLLHLGDRITNKPIRILGGGSNVLLVEESNHPVLHINIKGISVLKEEEEYVLVQFYAGENWHNAVMWALENNYGGIENLSLIPGRCGAAPMQNIGAYGVEIKDVLHTVSVYDLKTQKELTFHNEECGFGYRTSHFKTKWKNRFVITDIVLRLTKDGFHKTNISYGMIKGELEKKAIASPTIQQIGEVVTSIRRSKLPDPKVIGNAGSFFKNPVIPEAQADKLKDTYSDMPVYPAGEGLSKLPAGWLIDQCGWKGKVVGQTGTYKNQALVLVNHGQATGKEILAVSKEIALSVSDKFGIDLETEVNIW